LGLGFGFFLLFNSTVNFGHLHLSFHSAALWTCILQVESRRISSLRCHPILNLTPHSAEYGEHSLSTLTSFRFRKRRSLFLSRKPGRKRKRSGCHRCSTGTSQGRNWRWEINLVNQNQMMCDSVPRFLFTIQSSCFNSKGRGWEEEKRERGSRDDAHAHL